MKPAWSRSRRLVPLLLIAAAAVASLWFGGAGPADSSPSAVAAGAQASGAAPRSPSEMPSSEPRLDLSAVLSEDNRAQIQRVVQAMDLTGAPPRGVVQGGRRGGLKGVFQNAEGRLPRRPAGYWIESDVWPKEGPRGAERLVFGRGGEVYWTRDHYGTFVRLR